jgi:ATP-binding cassette, subfamily B, bacterial
MAARQGRVVFAIQSNIRLFRMITSLVSQSMALYRLVSLEAWPLLLISFLQTTRPILYGLSGSSFFGVTGKKPKPWELRIGITNPWYYRMKALRDVAMNLENRKQITVLGLDRWLLGEFDKACSELPEHTTYTPPNPSLQGNTHLIDGVIRDCLDAALFICAAFRSQYTGVDLGTVIVMKSAAATLSNSIINLHILIESAASEFQATKSYLDCIRLSNNLRRPKKHTPYCNHGGKGMEIEARNLHFSYSNNIDSKEVLRGVSFKIEAGETIGIVGFNGYTTFSFSSEVRAGKSTLVNLLCRLYDSTKGRLMINAHDVEEYGPSELRKHIAVLFQEKCRPF